MESLSSSLLVQTLAQKRGTSVLKCTFLQVAVGALAARAMARLAAAEGLVAEGLAAAAAAGGTAAAAAAGSAAAAALAEEEEGLAAAAAEDMRPQPQRQSLPIQRAWARLPQLTVLTGGWPWNDTFPFC